MSILCETLAASERKAHNLSGTNSISGESDRLPPKPAETDEEQTPVPQTDQVREITTCPSSAEGRFFERPIGQTLGTGEALNVRSIEPVREGDGLEKGVESLHIPIGTAPSEPCRCSLPGCHRTFVGGSFFGKQRLFCCSGHRNAMRLLLLRAKRCAEKTSCSSTRKVFSYLYILASGRPPP